MLGSLFLLAGLFHLADPSLYPGPLFHIASGGALLGAFFIATDPISGATSPRGRLLFGAGVGILVYVIRTYGGYPDAVAFSVLLMNMAAPTIDYYTRPRVYGHVQEED
jgi:electron transport complex protein RnfD